MSVQKNKQIIDKKEKKNSIEINEKKNNIDSIIPKKNIEKPEKILTENKEKQLLIEG